MPKPVNRLIASFGPAKTVPVKERPSSRSTVTAMPRNRSGCCCVDPSTGLNTDIPKRKASPAPKLPGWKCRVRVLGVREKEMPAGEMPDAEPTWNRFGMELQERSIPEVSSTTDWTVLELKGCTARPKE